MTTDGTVARLADRPCALDPLPENLAVRAVEAALDAGLTWDATVALIDELERRTGRRLHCLRLE